MKATVHAIAALLLLALSPTLFAFCEIFGVKPNLFLVYVIMAGFYASKQEAIWLGLIFGFLFDIIVGRAIGLSGILYMFACFFVTLLCENLIKRSNLIVVFACVVLGTVIFEGAAALFRNISAGDIGFLHIGKVIGIESAYNGILSVLLYVPLKKTFVRVYSEKG